jgi:hypothetical protein
MVVTLAVSLGCSKLFEEQNRRSCLEGTAAFLQLFELEKKIERKYDTYDLHYELFE